MEKMPTQKAGPMKKADPSVRLPLDIPHLPISRAVVSIGFALAIRGHEVGGQPRGECWCQDGYSDSGQWVDASLASPALIVADPHDAGGSSTDEENGKAERPGEVGIDIELEEEIDNDAEDQADHQRGDFA